MSSTLRENGVSVLIYTADAYPRICTSERVTALSTRSRARFNTRITLFAIGPVTFVDSFALPTGADVLGGREPIKTTMTFSHSVRPIVGVDKLGRNRKRARPKS